MKKRKSPIYVVGDEIGPYVHSGVVLVDSVVERIKSLVHGTQLGSRIILDFDGVIFIDPLFISAVIDKLVEEGNSHGSGIFRGRYIVAQNPSESVLEQIRLYLKDKHRDVSLSVVFTDTGMPRNGPSQIVLNLPPFLEETWNALRDQGPMRVRQISDFLGNKPGNVRERLRLLHQRGLVTREVEGDPKTVETYYRYGIFVM